MSLRSLEVNDGFRTFFYEQLNAHAEELDKLKAEQESRTEDGFAHFEDTFYPVVPPPEGYYPSRAPSVDERLKLAGRRTHLWLALTDVYGSKNVWLGPSLVVQADNGLCPEELRAFYVKGLPESPKVGQTPLQEFQPLQA